MKKINPINVIRDDARFRIAFIFMFIAIVIAMAVIFSFLMWPLMFAIVFFIALKGIHDRLCRITHGRTLSTFIIIFLFILLIIIPVAFLLYALAHQSYIFYQSIAFKISVDDITGLYKGNRQINEILRIFGISEQEAIQKTLELLKNVSYQFFTGLTGILGMSIGVVIDFFFMILILSAMFAKSHLLSELAYQIVPLPRVFEKGMFGRIREVIKVLVAGNGVIMLLQGLAVSVGFLLTGIPVYLLAGFIAAILSLIPVVGTSLVWIPAVIYFAVQGEFITALILGLWCFSAYMVLENVVKPKFFGDKLKFHPLVFFFLLIGSIGAFGIPGIIIGPVLLTVFFSLWEVYRMLYLEAEPVVKRKRV